MNLEPICVVKWTQIPIIVGWIPCLVNASPFERDQIVPISLLWQHLGIMRKMCWIDGIPKSFDALSTNNNLNNSASTRIILSYNLLSFGSITFGRKPKKFGAPFTVIIITYRIQQLSFSHFDS